MSIKFVAFFSLCAAALGFFKVNAVAVNSNLTCYECNTYRGGILNPCGDGAPTRTKNHCQACMKVHTRMEMHDYWSKPRVVVFESFTCVAKDFSIRPAGCYMNTGSRSLSKYCFCYTNLCNSSNQNGFNKFLSSILISISMFFYLTPSFS